MGNMMQNGAVAMVFFCLFSLDYAAAAGLYHCGGMVQYRPCDIKEDQIRMARRIREHRAVLRRRAGLIRFQLSPENYLENKRVRLVKSSYRRISKLRGEWTGVVAGQGLISLDLLIFREGVVEVRKHMGAVSLRRGGDTSFAFNTAVPGDNKWTWKIIVNRADL